MDNLVQTIEARQLHVHGQRPPLSPADTPLHASDCECAQCVCPVCEYAWEACACCDDCGAAPGACSCDGRPLTAAEPRSEQAQRYFDDNEDECLARYRQGGLI